MEIDSQRKKIILDYEKDYEMVQLVNHIVETKYGETKIKIKHSKPYQVIETQKSKLLTKDASKDSQDYGG